MARELLHRVCISFISTRSQNKVNIREFGIAAAAITAAAFMAGPAGAVPVMCETLTNNHMNVDSAYVSSCVAAGIGNINGNPATDDFLLTDGAGLGYTGIGAGGFTQAPNSNTGTFSLDSNLWNDWSSIAIGFKFGTGNQPDEWFIYLLNDLVSSGSWEFVNVFGKGGGLSHVQLYGVERETNVPEPGTLALFGLGVLGLGFAQRRKKV
jgi:hypothetical protein